MQISKTRFVVMLLIALTLPFIYGGVLMVTGLLETPFEVQTYAILLSALTLEAGVFFRRRRRIQTTT